MLSPCTITSRAKEITLHINLLDSRGAKKRLDYALRPCLSLSTPIAVFGVAAVNIILPHAQQRFFDLVSARHIYSASAVDDHTHFCVIELRNNSYVTTASLRHQEEISPITYCWRGLHLPITSTSDPSPWKTSGPCSLVLRMYKVQYSKASKCARARTAAVMHHDLNGVDNILSQHVGLEQLASYRYSLTVPPVSTGFILRLWSYFD